MKIWNYLGEFLMFRWMLGHRNSSHDSRDLDAKPYNPRHRAANHYASHDYRRDNTPLDTFDPHMTADDDFLEDLDHFDDF